MAKMGRPRKVDGKKDAQLSVRIATSLRDQLEAARRATESDRTLSQEVEMRLRQSFDIDGEIKKRFGSASAYGLLRMMAHGIEIVQWNCNASSGAEEKPWIDDPVVF